MIDLYKYWPDKFFVDNSYSIQYQNKVFIFSTMADGSLETSSKTPVASTDSDFSDIDFAAKLLKTHIYNLERIKVQNSIKII